ncbi:hypothetical protein RSAG8_03995, partial [Rhizoctonia solani AG-8 WAC10335]
MAPLAERAFIILGAGSGIDSGCGLVLLMLGSQDFDRRLSFVHGHSFSRSTA